MISTLNKEVAGDPQDKFEGGGEDNNDVNEEDGEGETSKEEEGESVIEWPISAPLPLSVGREINMNVFFLPPISFLFTVSREAPTFPPNPSNLSSKTLYQYLMDGGSLPQSI